MAIREVDNRTAKHTAEFHTTVRQLQRLRPHRNVVQLLGVCTQVRRRRRRRREEGEEKTKVDVMLCSHRRLCAIIIVVARWQPG